MLTGSSAIKNEARQKIVSPNVRTTLKENYNLRLSEPFSALNRVYDAVYFQDKLILYGNSDVSALTERIETWDITGTSLVSTTDFTTSGQDGRFHVEGNTAYFFHAQTLASFPPGSGATTQLYRLTSSDGETWGSSVTIFTDGDASGDLPDVRAIQGIAPVGPTRLYLLRMEGVTNPGNFLGLRRQVSIDSVRNSGSWGVTTIDTTMQWIDLANVSDSRIVARTYDNQDIFITQTAKTLTGGVGLHINKSDGNNVFEERSFIDSTSYERLFRMTNITQGATFFYLGFQTREPIVNLVGGVTTLTTLVPPPMIMQSIDMINWSIPRPLNGVSRLNTVENGAFIGAIATGITQDPEILWLGVTNGDIPEQNQQNASILIHGTEQDISGDIIDYNNNNNERISLTIGNLR